MIRRLLFAIALWFVPAAAAQTALPLPFTQPPLFDTAGNFLANGFVYTYASGTTTPQATFTDATGTVQNANPVTLNAVGFPVNGSTLVGIWGSSSTLYTLCFQNSAHVSQYCIDGVAGLLPTSSGGAVTSVTASPPFTSSGGVAPNISAATTGNGARVATSNAGSSTSTDVATWDANGNLQDSSVLLAALARLASPVFSGNPTGPTPAVNDNDTSLATTAFVHTQLLSGTQLLGNTTTANTQAVNDNTAKLATTAFVQAQIAASISSIVYATPSASTNASIGPTAMITVAGGNHTYRIAFMVDQTNLGIGCSADTGITTIVGYRDPNEAASSNTSVTPYDLGGNGALGKTGINILHSDTMGVAAQGQAFQALNGTSITYTVSIVQDVTCGTKPKVVIQPILELLN